MTLAKSNGMTGAFPLHTESDRTGPWTEWGLTKREAFAMAAMQGLCASDASPHYDKGACNAAIVARAVVIADALLAELAKDSAA